MAIAADSQAASEPPDAAGAPARQTARRPAERPAAAERSPTTTERAAAADRPAAAERAGVAGRPLSAGPTAAGPDLRLPRPPSIGSARPAVAAAQDSRPSAPPADRPTPQQTPAGPAPHGAVPPPGSAGARTAVPELDVTDVRKVWSEVLAVVKDKRRTTQVLLEGATVVAVQRNALQLSMPSAGLARRVMEISNSEVLRAALRQVLGVEWSVNCEGPQSTGPDPDGPRSPSGTAASAGPAAAAAQSRRRRTRTFRTTTATSRRK